jgi:hypothetical protein
VLGAIGNQSVDELATLSFSATATDADLPADTLLFSLDAASLAAGMSIDANTGVFSWTPSGAQDGTTPAVTVTVTDSGSGNLVDSETFSINVNNVGNVNNPPAESVTSDDSESAISEQDTKITIDSDTPTDTDTNNEQRTDTAVTPQLIDANLGPAPVNIFPQQLENIFNDDNEQTPQNHPTIKGAAHQELRKQAQETLIFNELPTPSAGIEALQSEQDFQKKLDEVKQEIADAFEEQQTVTATIQGLAITISSGVMIWVLRASSLILTMLSITPPWKGLDPLPVLAASKKRRVQEIISQHKDKLAEDADESEVGHLFDNDQTRSKPKVADDD